jgi:hypothetical protein
MQYKGVKEVVVRGNGHVCTQARVGEEMIEMMWINVAMGKVWCFFYLGNPGIQFYGTVPGPRLRMYSK